MPGPQPIASPWPMTARIDAALLWNDTGILLEADRSYALAAAGEWVDWTIAAGPEGNPNPVWTQRLLASQLRAPGVPYFTLMGALDEEPASIFRIGTGCRYAPPRNGRLTCFANDIPWMLWNNRGTVLLTVAPA